MNIFNNSKGIIIAVFLFAILHYSISYFANSIIWTQENHMTLLKWINISATSIYFVCGLVASMFYKKNHILIGSITGLFSALTAIIFFKVSFNEVSGMFVTIAIGIILGTLGGLTSMLIKHKFKNAL